MGSESSQLDKSKQQQGQVQANPQQLYHSFEQQQQQAQMGQYQQQQQQHQQQQQQQQQQMGQQQQQQAAYQQYVQQYQQYAAQQPQQLPFQAYMQAQAQQQAAVVAPVQPPVAPAAVPPQPNPQAQALQYAHARYPSSHQFSNLQRMMHISASNPQLTNMGLSTRKTPPNSNNLTPAGTPSLPQNKAFMSQNPVFTFQNTPFGAYSKQPNDEYNESPLRKSLSRHVSDTNINKKPAVLENIIPNNINNLLPGKRQKLIVLRHGERVDSTFGPTWVENCFDAQGRYNRFNLNMPKTLPHRDNPKYEYLYDPPLTEMGLHQAKLTGEELSQQGMTISHCYCSPALRSIQTVDKILEGMGLKDTVPIKVEIGLYEFLRWQTSIPNKYPFMDLRSLVAAGYNIDLTYNSLIPYEMLRYDENEEGYYQRSYYMSKTLVDRHASDGGNIIFGGHAPSIEVCTRQLCGGEPRINEFRTIVRKVPFLSIALCEKNPVTQKWKLKKTPIPPLKHLSVDEFDYKNLQNKPINENSPYMYGLSAANGIVRQPGYAPAWRI